MVHLLDCFALVEFFGHVMRRAGLEHLVVTGKLEGKRGRKRPRVGYVKALSEWAEVEWAEVEWALYGPPWPFLNITH